MTQEHETYIALKQSIEVASCIFKQAEEICNNFNYSQHEKYVRLNELLTLAYRVKDTLDAIKK